jgi:hypothetical protein
VVLRGLDDGKLTGTGPQTQVLLAEGLGHVRRCRSGPV